jgi:uncharacterized protein YhbP (UPF0306 family)
MLPYTIVYTPWQEKAAPVHARSHTIALDFLPASHYTVPMETSITHVINELNALKQNLGVIATAGTSPEAAVVYFTYDEALNIYFTTRKDSRKYQNLAATPRAAFVVFNSALLKTIQFEGTVRAIENPTEQAAHYAQLVDLATAHNPLPPIDQLGESEIMFLKFETTWARVGNFEIARKGDVFEQVTI